MTQRRELSSKEHRQAPSQKDVAELAGVPSQTVSRVVNNRTNVDAQTRERVLTAMRVLGYWTNGAARTLATGQSRAFGLISFDLSAHGNARTIEAIAAAAQEAEYSVNIAGISAATEEAVQRAYARLTSQAVDGVVLIEARILDTATIHLPTSVPVVIADGDPGRNFPAVEPTRRRELATRPSISWTSATRPYGTSPVRGTRTLRRAAAWHATLKQHRRIIPPLLYGDWSAESGLAAGRTLAERDDVTAIFAANDHMALDIIRALREAGRAIPGDVSIVGFDDVREASCFLPPLTTIHQDFEAVGRRCVELLLDQITRRGDASAGAIASISPHLVERASTARPRGH